jgi:uncharacterized membrane protein
MYKLKPLWYAGILLASVIWLGLAIGPGMWNPELTLFEWHQSGLKQFFGYACHQHPLRTFFLSDHVPMNVCSRCIGIYGGLTAGVGIIPFLITFTKPLRRFVPSMLWVAIGLNVASVVCSWIDGGLITNTIRVLLGLLFGLSIPLLFIDSLTTSTS